MTTTTYLVRLDWKEGSLKGVWELQTAVGVPTLVVPPRSLLSIHVSHTFWHMLGEIRVEGHTMGPLVRCPIAPLPCQISHFVSIF